MSKPMRIFDGEKWVLISSGAVTSEDEKTIYTAEDIKNSFDEKINKTGDTMTGELKIDTSRLGSNLTLTGGGVSVDLVSPSGTWSRNLLDFLVRGERVIRLGAFGNGEDFEFLYVGKSPSERNVDFLTNRDSKFHGNVFIGSKNVLTEISSKVDKVDGMGLSTNDYTNDDKSEVQKVKNKAEQVDLKALEHFEKGNEASNDNGEFYEDVKWYNKDGSVYATSKVQGDVLTLTYAKDNKTIKWKLTFDNKGFPFKKELI